MFAIAAVSVISKTSWDGSIGALVSSASIRSGSSGSQIEWPERFTSRTTFRALELLLLDQPDRLADHPDVDLGDQAEALGNRQERARGNDASVVVEHPNEELVAVRRLPVQARDRLRVDGELVVAERAS